MTYGPETPVLFYDGECGLCARAVQWCLRHDRRGVLRFAPLAGATFAMVPEAGKPHGMQTMVVYDCDGLHLRGDAVLRMLGYVGGGWAWLAAVGRIVPRFVRNWVYGYVAKRRMGWFGTADRCQVPPAGQAERFLP